MDARPGEADARRAAAAANLARGRGIFGLESSISGGTGCGLRLVMAETMVVPLARPPAAPPSSSPSLRALALPTEHGGWGLLLEPLLLGLLIVPSAPGAAVAAAALGAFLW